LTDFLPDFRKEPRKGLPKNRLFKTFLVGFHFGQIFGQKNVQNEIFFIKVWATFFLGVPSRYPIFNFQCENHFFVLERVIEMNVMKMALLGPCVFGRSNPSPMGTFLGGRAKRACMQIFVRDLVWDIRGM